MINREFVQKYLDIKDMWEHETINETRYKTLILNLCDKYRINPEKLAEYNIDIEPRKIKINKICY